MPTRPPSGLSYSRFNFSDLPKVYSEHNGDTMDDFSTTFDRAPSAAVPPESADDGWEWMIVEVMGHRRHAGRTREEERFGAKFIRVDVPNKGDPDQHGWTTHYYPPTSLFGFTPAEQDACLKANKPYEAPTRLALPGPDDDDWPV